MTSPIYDSRETGPRFHVTSRVGNQTIVFQERVDDPFVRHTVHLHWRDMLRALLTFKRTLPVTVTVGGDRDVVEAVLELDDNYLGLPSSPRRKAFHQQINDALGGFALAEELNEPTGQQDGEAGHG